MKVTQRLPSCIGHDRESTAAAILTFKFSTTEVVVVTRILKDLEIKSLKNTGQFIERNDITFSVNGNSLVVMVKYTITDSACAEEKYRLQELRADFKEFKKTLVSALRVFEEPE